ncbi:hypothetical protein STENM223S_04258 [Streptomyces tendae]
MPEQRLQQVQLLRGAGGRREGARPRQLVVAARLGGPQVRERRVGPAGQQALAGGRVGVQVEGELHLPVQRLHDTDVGLLADTRQHERQVVAGGQLRVAGHVPGGGPAHAAAATTRSRPGARCSCSGWPRWAGSTRRRSPPSTSGNRTAAGASGTRPPRGGRARRRRRRRRRARSSKRPAARTRCRRRSSPARADADAAGAAGAVHGEGSQALADVWASRSHEMAQQIAVGGGIDPGSPARPSTGRNAWLTAAEPNAALRRLVSESRRRGTRPARAGGGRGGVGVTRVREGASGRTARRPSSPSGPGAGGAARGPARKVPRAHRWALLGPRACRGCRGSAPSARRVRAARRAGRGLTLGLRLGPDVGARREPSSVDLSSDHHQTGDDQRTARSGARRRGPASR